MSYGYSHKVLVIAIGLISLDCSSRPRFYLTFVFQKKSIGQELMEQVYYHLDIIEKDYFGLQYTDPYNVPHWLDPTKIVKKQVKSEGILLYSAFWSKLSQYFCDDKQFCN